MVILIIGIIAATGVPVYHDYIVKSKIAEAYNILDVMGKNEVTYYVQNQEFYNQSDYQPLYLDQPMVIYSDVAWSVFGYPAPVNSPVHFAYRSMAGKIDSTGTELTLAADSISGRGFMPLTHPDVILGKYGNGIKCNNGGSTPTTFGAVSQNDYNWSIQIAIGDLDFDQGDSCTAIIRLLESASFTQKKPAYAGGYIILNQGD